MNVVFNSPTRVRGFDPALASELEELVDQFNSGHMDALLLIGGWLGASLETEAAQIVQLSPKGFELVRARRGEPTDSVFAAFSETVASLEALQGQVVGLLLRARQDAGDTVPLTRFEREMQKTRTLPTFVTEVSAARSLSPNLRELTLRGGLGEFRDLGPDQFVYVMVPRPGRDSMIQPGVTMAALRALPEDEKPQAAYYTVRNLREEQGELDLWCVVHGDTVGVGGWARSAAPGDRLAIWGPRSSFSPPSGARALLLVGDETALPAIAAIIERTDLPCRVFVETIDADHTILLPERGGVEVTWVFRGQQPPQESTALLDAVRRHQRDWPEALAAFGAGESSRVLGIRRYLRGLGAPPNHVQLTAYWRSGRALNP